MCTPTSHNWPLAFDFWPLAFSPIALIDRASSKSLASLGSMVHVHTSRKSSRRRISCSVMPGSIFSAASSTAFGYLYGKPYWARMACISTLLSPSLPNTSMTSPTIFFESFDGHCVIFTTAFSPSLPPFSFFLGMRMSCTKMFPSVIRKA